jgi:hypothetical protein
VYFFDGGLYYLATTINNVVQDLNTTRLTIRRSVSTYDRLINEIFLKDLNMTRRATRPFVPTNDPAYFDLQRQVNLLETMPVQPVRAPR